MGEEYGPYWYEDPGYYGEYGPYYYEDPGYYGEYYGPENPGIGIDYGENYGPENPGIGIDYGNQYGPGFDPSIWGTIRGLLGSGGLLGGLPWSQILGAGLGYGLGSGNIGGGPEWRQTPALPGAMDEYTKTLQGNYLTTDNPIYKKIMDDAQFQWGQNLTNTMGRMYQNDMTGPLTSRSGFNENLTNMQRVFGDQIGHSISANMFNPERNRMSGYAMAGLPQNYSENSAAGGLGGALLGSQLFNLFNK